MATGVWKYKVLDIAPRWITIQAGFFRALEEAGYSGICLSIGIGSTKDRNVDAYYAQARAETSSSFKIGFYYVPNPLYTVQANVNYALQFASGKSWDFVSTDYERTFGVSWSTYRAFMLTFQAAMEFAFDPLIILPYSNKNFMSYIADAAAFRTWIWWIANYYNSISVWPSPTAKPWALPPQLTLANVGMWQFIASWRELHSPSDLDANVAWQELDMIFEAEPVPPSPATAGLVFVSVQEGLRIRSGPGTGFVEVGRLSAGEEVTALDVGGSNAWIQHSRGWSNVQYGDDENMRVKS